MLRASFLNGLTRRSLFPIAVASAIAGLSMASLAGAGDAGSSASTPACWPDQELAGEAGDKAIRKNIQAARRDPPAEAAIESLPAPRGAIRRVELPPGDKRISLTFDLCEQPYEVAGYDAELVNVLRETATKATFFGGGKWMLTHSVKTQQILSDPLFEMGNHAWEHRNLRLLEGARQKSEISWAQVAYERQVKALAARQCVARGGEIFRRTQSNQRMTLFRFPFGACNPAALDAVAESGLLPIQWDVSSGDPTNTITPEAMAAAVARQVRPGSIVLFHANGRGWNTAAALRILIPALRAKGYEFATVTELLQTEGAKVVREGICYDAKPGDVDRHDALARRLSLAYDQFYARFPTANTDSAASPEPPLVVPVPRLVPRKGAEPAEGVPSPLAPPQ